MRRQARRVASAIEPSAISHGSRGLVVSRRFILASASAGRKELLEQAGYDFEVRVAPPGAEEAALAAARSRGGTTEELILAAARAKAQTVAATLQEDVVILAADTLVRAADGRILGKGADEAESRAILAALAGTRHQVISGVVLIDLPGGRRRELVACSEVQMAPMSVAEIDEYVRSGGAVGAAGAYRVQKEGSDRYVRVLSGSFSNVVGLPMEEIIPVLSELGVDPDE
jgi:septum formation protein